MTSGKTHEFGLTDRLRAAREGAGLSQQELADATGISRQSISNYESAHAVPRRPSLLAWAIATGYDYDWLATGITPEVKPRKSRPRREGRLVSV